MLEEQNKNRLDKIKSYLDLRVAGLLVFGVIAIMITWSGLKVAKQNYDLEKQISQLEQRNEVEFLENENLKLKNEYYKSDQYLELAARRHFNKAAPGERLYLIPESVARENTVNYDKPEQSGESAPDKPEKQRNFDDWMEFLFGAKN